MKRIHIHRGPRCPPLILIPAQGAVSVGSVHYFQPKRSPPFPDDYDEMTREVENLSLTGRQEGKESIAKWAVETEDGLEVKACAVSEGGKLLIGVGEKEHIWIWRRDT